MSQDSLDCEASVFNWRVKTRNTETAVMYNICEFMEAELEYIMHYLAPRGK
jgi:hypothetical protein